MEIRDRFPLHAARITKPTLRTERESALLGKRFPFLLAATGSQTAVSCLEVTGVIESTSTDATGIRALHTGWTDSPLLLSSPKSSVCNSSAVGQLNTKGKPGSGASSLPASTIFQQTNEHIYIIIYTHTRARRHIHTDRTERKGGIAGKGESHNPAVRPRALSCRAVFHAPTPKCTAPASSQPQPTENPRVCWGKSRHGCSPAASRLGL